MRGRIGAILQRGAQIRRRAAAAAAAHKPAATLVSIDSGRHVERDHGG